VRLTDLFLTELDYNFCYSTMLRNFFLMMILFRSILSLRTTGALVIAAPENFPRSNNYLTARRMSSSSSSSSEYVSSTSKTNEIQQQQQQQQRPTTTISSFDRVLDPLIVCGPSGVGKGTIIHKYMEEGSRNFGFTVSHTTRSPRPGEIEGVHYYFSTKEKMEEDIKNGLFLEHAAVHGNLYGTSWQSLKGSGKKRCLLDIDVQGVKTLKQQQVANKKFQPRYIFIAPPSLPSLLKRLESRGTETPESLRIRTSKAKEELEYGLAEGNFDAVIVNDDLTEACLEFQRVVQKLYID